MPAAAISDKRLNHTALKVLGELATYTDDNGWCFPKQTTIGTTLDLGRPAVNRACQKLAECGYLEIHHRYREDGGKMANYYRVVLDPPVGPDGEMRQNVPRTDEPEVGSGGEENTPHVLPAIHTPCASSDTSHVLAGDTSHDSLSDTSRTTQLNDPTESEDARAWSDTSVPPVPSSLRDALVRLSGEVGEATANSWLKGLVIISHDPPTLAASSQFIANYVEAHFGHRLEEMLGRRIRFEKRNTGARRAPHRAPKTGRTGR
tara:strand:+ start:7963 stop:8745 length:783 start_codon:yes stop_codon:yes gene_type:complete